MPIGHNQIDNTHYHDVHSLDHLKKSAQSGALSDEKALRAVANQFESMFTSILFSSMRSANAAFDDGEIFDKRYVKFYQEMLDKQLSADISRRGSLGIADLLVNSFSQQNTVNRANRPEDGFYALEKPQVFQSIEMVRKTDTGVPLTADKKENKSPMGEVLAANDIHRLKTSKHTLPTLDKSHLGEVNIVAFKTRFLPEQKNQSTITQSVPEKTVQDVSAEPMFGSPQDFIRKILPMARQAAEKSGLDPLALVAQSALESGWGRHMIQKSNGKVAHNLFGVKAQSGWQGERARSATTEFEQGIARKTMADFRAYDSIKESIDDFVNLITGSSRYQEAKRVAKEPERYFEELQNAGYATDPRYADKLKRVLGTVKRLLTEAVR